VDEARAEIIVRGDPQESTKNSEMRRIPIIPAMEDLLKRIRSRCSNEEPSYAVLRVNEAQKSMDNAGQKVGMQRITHHDLRHFFATICIESGVDIPTVSKWLGHKDGGALAMQVYGHLRNEHSRAAAKKVSFKAS
jgi:integrase